MSDENQTAGEDEQKPVAAETDQVVTGVSDDMQEVDLGTTVISDEIKSVPLAVAEEMISNTTENFIDDALGETDIPIIKANDFTPMSTVEMESSPFADSKKPLAVESSLAILMQGVEEIEELALKHGLNFDDQKQDETLTPPIRRLKTILGTLVDSLQTNYFQKVGTREGSDWGQGMLHGDALIRAGKAKLSPNADPVLRIRNEMGLGSLVQIPLWHSGYWITLKTPSDSALLELEERMSMEKITLGRSSNGLIFSSAEIYTKNHLIDFIFDHVYAVTLDSKEPALLRSVTLDSDYPQLVWGMALACYPSGYPLMQPCVANPDTCQHVVEALINLSRISWLDRSRLSAAQRVHMLNRVSPSSLAKIEIYQKEFNATIRGEIEIHEKVSLRMRVPTLAESKSIGFDWVEQILDTTQKAFGMRMAEGQRENYVQNQALITSLRQYGQWFDAVVRNSNGEDEEIITDRKAVDEIITMIASNNEISAKVYRSVRDFIDNATISMIALPKWKCPACQKEPDEKYLRHPKLVPLDVVQVFFTLRDQKVTNKLVAETNRVI